MDEILDDINDDHNDDNGVDLPEMKIKIEDVRTITKKIRPIRDRRKDKTRPKRKWIPRVKEK